MKKAGKLYMSLSYDKQQVQTYHIKKLNKPHYSVLAKSKIFILISFTTRCISIHHAYFHRNNNNLDRNVSTNVNIPIPNNF